MFVCEVCKSAVVIGRAIGSALKEGCGFKGATGCRIATDAAPLVDG